MKRLWIVVVIMLALAVAAFLWMMRTGIIENEKTTYDALLPNTSIVFSFNDVGGVTALIDSAPYSSTLSQTGFFGRMLAELDLLDSLTRKEFLDFSALHLLVAPYPTAKNEYAFLYATPLNIASLNNNQFTPTTNKATQHQFKGHTIWKLALGDSFNFSFAEVGGVLVASTEAFLVEEAVAQLQDGPSILEDKGFKTVFTPLKANSDVAVFINYARLSTVAEIVLDKNKWPDKILYHWAGWSGFELNIRDNDILFTGYTSADTGYLATANYKPADAMELDQYLPANTAMFLYRGLGESAENKTNSGFYLLLKEYAELVGNQEIWGVLESLDEDYSNDIFMMSLLADTARARLQLEELVKLSANIDIPMEYKGVPIYTITKADLLKNPRGLLLSQATTAFATIYGNAVYWADDVKTLKQVLAALLNDRTLGINLRYQKLRNNISSNPNEYVYLSPSLMKQLISAALLGESSDAFLGVSDLAIQYNIDGDAFFTFGLIEFGDVVAGSSNTDIAVTHTESQQLWTVQLDTTMVNNYWYVINHNTGTAEVLVQDAKAQLYQIDNNGKVLWKKQLDGLILDDVHQVDLYKNEKLQLVFATATQMYLLDRNGDNVEQFPIKLPGTATSGLSVVEYDNSRNYRYFIACEKYKVYGYYGNGKPLPGWSPKNKQGTITYPMQYSVAGGKDYLVLTNVDGTILLYDRKGDNRLRPVRLDDTFSQAPYITNDGTLHLFNCSEKGVVYEVTSIGAVVKTDLPVGTTFSQFVATGSSDSLFYAFLDSNELRVLNKSLAETASLDLTSGVMDLFIVDRPNTQFDYIGLNSEQDNSVYCFTPGLELLPGFPITGNSRFAITKAMFKGNNEKVVVVGDKQGNLSAYRLP